MSNQTKTPPTIANGTARDVPADIDKKALYGNYQKTADWREQVAEEATRKALDLKTGDDMNINAPRVTNVNGIGIKGLIAAVLAGVIPTAALGALALWMLSRTPATPPQATAPAAAAFDKVTEEQQPDGTWKIVDRVPYK